MCLYPKTIANPRYLPNRKNGGFPSTPKDSRLRGIEIGCGVCIECRKKRANSWRARLIEELKDNPTDKFVTLTFSDEYLDKFETEEANETAARAIELFRKRWWIKYKKALKYWLIVELGHPNENPNYKSTERVHLHGIIWTNISKEEFEEIWKYGWVDFGEYVNEKSINYIVKYVTKCDEDHPNFIGQIFTSKGIGKGYIKRHPKRDVDTYRTPSGLKITMPAYYKERIFTEEEREEMRIEKMDKGIKYINGQKVNITTKEGKTEYREGIIYERARAKKLGYICKPWKKIKYKKKVSPTDI